MFLPQPTELVSQGDIFEDIPIAYVYYEPGSRQPTSDVRLVRAILLSHDCEYDKPNSQFVAVAEIRPLSEIPVGSQGNVRQYRTRNTFYLEPIGDLLPESFVDFRRIDRVQKIILTELHAGGQRLASLSEDARLALQRQIAIFFGYGR